MPANIERPLWHVGEMLHRMDRMQKDWVPLRVLENHEVQKYAAYFEFLLAKHSDNRLFSYYDLMSLLNNQHA